MADRHGKDSALRTNRTGTAACAALEGSPRHVAVPRATRTGLGLLLGATLSAAALGMPAGTATPSEPIVDIDDSVTPEEYLSITFDGRELGWATVTDIARNPVLDWGFVRDESGAFVENEVWMIVARAGRFVYFHLIGEANDARGPTTYSGYTVKVKVVLEHTIMNFGAGGDVPWIGSDDEAFTEVSATAFLNDRFAGFQQAVDLGTGDPTDQLVELGTSLSWASVPLSRSAGLTGHVQHVDAGGALVEEAFLPLRQAAFDASVESLPCDASAPAAASIAASLTSGPWADETLVMSRGLQLLGGGLDGSVPLMGEASVLEAGVNRGLAKSITWLTEGLYATAAEAACNGHETGAWEVGPYDLELDVPEFIDISMVVVCDVYGVEEPSDHWLVLEGTEGQALTLNTELVCTDWHVEVVGN